MGTNFPGGQCDNIHEMPSPYDIIIILLRNYPRKKKSNEFTKMCKIIYLRLTVAKQTTYLNIHSEGTTQYITKYLHH